MIQYIYFKSVLKGAVVMNKDKIEELIAASKLNELLHKKDVEESKKKSNVIIIVLAVIGAVAALAAIVYAIYRYFTPDYLDDFAHPAANVFMELLVSEGAEVLASYEHYNWKDYAAITRNHYGKGQAVYIGCMTDEETLKSVYKAVLPEAGVEIPEYHYPIIVRKGLNDLGKTVCYFLNYSGMELEMPYDYKNGIELLENTAVENGTALQMPAWGVKIVEEA